MTAGILRRHTGHRGPRLDIPGHAALRRDARAGADFQMAGHSGLTAKHNHVAKPGASGNTNLRNDEASLPDMHVMSDLDQIINLGSGTDISIRPAAPVDGTVGADLDIVLDDHPAQLRNLFMARGAGAKPKPSWPIRTPG